MASAAAAAAQHQSEWAAVCGLIANRRKASRRVHAYSICTSGHYWRVPGGCGGGQQAKRRNEVAYEWKRRTKLTVDCHEGVFTRPCVITTVRPAAGHCHAISSDKTEATHSSIQSVTCRPSTVGDRMTSAPAQSLRWTSLQCTTGKSWPGHGYHLPRLRRRLIAKQCDHDSCRLWNLLWCSDGADIFHIADTARTPFLYPCWPRTLSAVKMSTIAWVCVVLCYSNSQCTNAWNKAWFLSIVKTNYHKSFDYDLVNSFFFHKKKTLTMKKLQLFRLNLWLFSETN